MAEVHKNVEQNRCYDPSCDKKECFNPEHFNYICMDPNCENTHCMNHQHYNKKLLKDFQEHTDFSVYQHNTEKIEDMEDVDVKMCTCDDCNDDEHHHHHEHDHHEDNCDCCDDDDIKICNCDDCCDDDDDEEEVIKEGVPLIQNRSIQIIVSSGILFVIGHILNYFSVYNGIPATLVFGLGAVISGSQYITSSINVYSSSSFFPNRTSRRRCRSNIIILPIRVP